MHTQGQGCLLELSPILVINLKITDRGQLLSPVVAALRMLTLFQSHPLLPSSSLPSAGLSMHGTHMNHTYPKHEYDLRDINATPIQRKHDEAFALFICIYFNEAPAYLQMWASVASALVLRFNFRGEARWWTRGLGYHVKPLSSAVAQWQFMGNDEVDPFCPSLWSQNVENGEQRYENMDVWVME